MQPHILTIEVSKKCNLKCGHCFARNPQDPKPALSLETAKEIGFSSVVVLGHPTYYPRFGFQPASKWGIICPFPAPDEAFMALELFDGGLSGISGKVIYPSAFTAV